MSLPPVESGPVLVLQEGHEGDVTGVAFHPDGGTLVSSGIDGTIKIWDPTTGMLRGSFAAHREIWGVGVVGDGEEVVFATTVPPLLGGDAWGDRLSLRRSTFVPDPGGRGTCRRRVAANAASDCLVCGDESGEIGIWTAGRGWVATSIRAHGGGETAALAVRPDGAIVASSGWDARLHLWSVATAETVASWRREYRVAPCLAFAPDGRTLAAGYTDGVIVLLDTDLQPLAEIETGGKPLRALAFAPDGRTLVAGADGGAVTLWSVPDRSSLATIQAHVGGVSALAFHPDGTSLVSGGGDGAIRLWNAADGIAAGVLSEGLASMTCAAFSPSLGRVVTADVRGHVRVWNPAVGSLIAAWRAHDGPVEDVAIDDTDGTVVSSDRTGAFAVWSPGSADARWRDTCPEPCARGPWPVVGAAAGAVAVGCCGAHVTAYDAATGEVRLTIPQSDAVLDIIVLAGGHRAVIASVPGKVRLLDLDAGTVVAERAADRWATVAASWDGRWVLYSIDAPRDCLSGSLVLWNMQTLETTFLRMCTNSRAVAFEPGGERLLVADYSDWSYLYDSAFRPVPRGWPSECPPANPHAERLGIRIATGFGSLAVGFLSGPEEGLTFVDSSRLALLRLAEPARIFLTALAAGDRDVAVAYTEAGSWDSDDPDAAARHLLYRTDPDLRATRLVPAGDLAEDRRHPGLVQDFVAGAPTGTPIDAWEFPEPTIVPPCSGRLLVE